MVYLSRADLTKKARKLESLETGQQVKTTGALGYIILLLVFFVALPGGITTTWNLENTGQLKEILVNIYAIVISTK